MSMDQLPPELLYYILSKQDGHSLGCCSGVCRQWRSIVTNLGQVFNIWFRICLKELGLNTIIAQTGLTWLASEAGQVKAESLQSQWRFWQRLFAANFHCQRLRTEGWEVVKETVLEKEYDEVVKIAVHPCSYLYGEGKFFVGCLQGTVNELSVATTFSTPPAQPPFQAIHRFSTSAVAVLALDGSPGYDLGSGEQKMPVLSTSIIGDVILSNFDQKGILPVCGLGHQIFSISSLGQYFAVVNNRSMVGGVKVYHMTQRPQWEQFPEEFRFPYEPLLQLRGCLRSKMETVALAYDQVVAGDLQGNLYCWRFAPLCRFGAGGERMKGGGGRGERRKGPEKMEAPSDSMKLSYGIKQVLFHQDCVIALTCVGQAEVYVIQKNDWRVVQQIRDTTLRSLAFNTVTSVTCLAVCANLLALGFQSGEVVVLNTSAKDWTRDLSGHVVCVFRSQDGELQTMEFMLGPEGPVLVVGGKDVVVCRWRRPPRGQQQEEAGEGHHPLLVHSVTGSQGIDGGSEEKNS